MVHSDMLHLHHHTCCVYFCVTMMVLPVHSECFVLHHLSGNVTDTQRQCGYLSVGPAVVLHSR